MTFNPGRLDRRIRIERYTVTTDDYGGEIRAWTKLADRWAGKSDISDAEKSAAAQLDAIAVARFTVRSDSITRTINPKDRIVYADANWNITGIKEKGERRQFLLEITAVRQAD